MFKKIILIIFINYIFIIIPCSDFLIEIEDGKGFIEGRTYDTIGLNGVPFDSDPFLLFNQGGKMFKSENPAGEMTFFTPITKYSFVSINALDNNDYTCHGVNEKGLSLAILWLPNETKYIDNSKVYNSEKAIKVSDLIKYILSMFKDVKEIKEFLKSIYIWAPRKDNYTKEIYPTAHFVVYDNNKNSIICEFINEKIQIHDNKIKVLTNSPNYSWHIKNLGNYLNIKNDDILSKNFKNIKILQNGQGNGLYGLPGDFTSPSRFIRIFFLKEFAKSVKTKNEAIILTANIIGNVTVPSGSSGEDYTQWVLINDFSDLNNMNFYFKDQTLLNFIKINLNDILNNKKDGWKMYLNDLIENNEEE